MRDSKKVQFKLVQTYYFERSIGYDKVPERGSNPLGMEFFHCFYEESGIGFDRSSSKKLTNPNSNSEFILSSAKCSNIHLNVNNNYTNDGDNDDDDESNQSVISIDYTSKSLQPLTPSQRKKCLESCGIEKSTDIDKTHDTKGLTKIRQERQHVGCKCSNSKCDPNRCICSKEGIPCQSDMVHFPCKCGDKCSNPVGKKSYSSNRYKHHIKHTLERLISQDSGKIIEDYLASTAVTGDCSVCNAISDQQLKEMYQADVITRKRTAATKFEFIPIKKAAARSVIQFKSKLSSMIPNGGPLCVIQESPSKLLTDVKSDEQTSPSATYNDRKSLNKSPMVTARTETIEGVLSTLHISDKENIFSNSTPLKTDKDFAKSIDVSPVERSLFSERIQIQTSTPWSVKLPSSSIYIPDYHSSDIYDTSYLLNSFEACVDGYSTHSFFGLSNNSNQEMFNQLYSSIIDKAESFRFNPISLAADVSEENDEINNCSNIIPNASLQNIVETNLHPPILEIINHNKYTLRSSLGIFSKANYVESPISKKDKGKRKRFTRYQNNNRSPIVPSFRVTTIECVTGENGEIISIPPATDTIGEIPTEQEFEEERVEIELTKDPNDDQFETGLKFFDIKIVPDLPTSSPDIHQHNSSSPENCTYSSTTRTIECDKSSAVDHF